MLVSNTFKCTWWNFSHWIKLEEESLQPVGERAFKSSNLQYKIFPLSPINNSKYMWYIFNESTFSMNVFTASFGMTSVRHFTLSSICFYLFDLLSKNILEWKVWATYSMDWWGASSLCVDAQSIIIILSKELLNW